MPTLDDMVRFGNRGGGRTSEVIVGVCQKICFVPQNLPPHCVRVCDQWNIPLSTCGLKGHSSSYRSVVRHSLEC